MILINNRDHNVDPKNMIMISAIIRQLLCTARATRGQSLLSGVGGDWYCVEPAYFHIKLGNLRIILFLSSMNDFMRS